MTLDRVPIVDFLWLSVDITGLPSCGFYISQLVRFARCCSIAFLISILKIFKTIQNYWRSVTDITNFEKHFEVSLDHTRPELLSNGSISFQEYACMFQQEFSPDILRSSGLQTKGSQIRNEFHLVGLENSYI